MKTGMIRKIDELGRIVIPKEIRKSLKLNMGDIVEIYLEDNKILLKRHSTMLGLEEELFNIAKVLNELTNGTILFIENENIIISYGKNSQLYLDQKINKQIYNKLTENRFLKFKNIYLISNKNEEKIVHIAPLYCKQTIQGLFIIIENDHNLTTNEQETINQFRKFILKQLDT